MSDGVCSTLGCEGEPVENGYCRECVDISPGVTDEDVHGPVNPAGEEVENDDLPESTPFERPEDPPSVCDLQGEPSEVTLSGVPEVETHTYPGNLTGTPWFAWKPTSDGRKVPRAPWVTGGDAFVSAQDPEIWTDQETAKLWINTLPGYGLAINIRDREEHPEESVVLIDFDKARDPESGRWHPTARKLIERARSYADVSTSDTGGHILARGALPDGVKSIDAALPDCEEFPKAEIEVYDSGRFVAMSGKHVQATPTEIADAQELIDELADEYATVAEGTPDELTREPEKSREELADVDATEDIQDVFDAIQHTGPRDIRLRSPVTHERGDSKSRDPAWRESESGTGLAEVGGGWIERKGMHGLGALQVVGLEERIISRPDEYPTGETFWEAVDALRERGAHIPEYDGSKNSGNPVSTLPLAQLDALDPDARRRAAKKRGLSWPTTDELREKISRAFRDAVRDEKDVVFDPPTGSGKSFTAATTLWTELDVTESAPVIQLSETREARDQAAHHTREHGGAEYTLVGRREACPVAGGDHDPLSDEEREQGEQPPEQVITVDGTPASIVFDRLCDDKGIPFSVAHGYIDEHNDQSAFLPCCPPVDASPDSGRQLCPAVAQWNGIPRDDEGEASHDVIHATHPFAHVPGLTRGSVVIFDEQPDFTADLGQERIRKMVGAFLEAVDAPVTTFETFVGLARMGYGGGRSDAARERDALADAILDHEPGRDWYLTHPDAHALAPAVVRALWHALNDDADANGRCGATVPHEPPRLDANAHEDEGWNREWVSVTVDEQNTIRRVRAAPDLSQTRCVIGLDAHPTASLWQLNTKPSIEVESLLDPDERRLWRCYERGLRVVQVGDAVRPAGKNGRYAQRDSGREVFIKHLREHYGSAFETAITDIHTESDLRQVMAEAGIDVGNESTMHFGEEKSRGDFAGQSIGAVLGCIDAGDSYVLDTLAELGLDARPETNTCEKCDGEGCSDDHNCHDGVRRARGRGFVGSDADTAQALIESVRENHVAQAAGRYARDADDPEDTAIVFCRTSALPTGYADHKVAGVERIAGEKQRAVTEAARENPGSTARKLKEIVDEQLPRNETVSKRHVGETLTDLLSRGVAREEGAGAYGADTWDAQGLTDAGVSGEVELTTDEITNRPVWDTNTWEFAIHAPHSVPHERSEPSAANEWGSLSPEPADGGDGPPDGSR